jgi:hypothetical protein
MSKERLQEIKDRNSWLYVNNPCGVNLEDISWLISEVERLQAENEELTGSLNLERNSNQYNFEQLEEATEETNELQQKVERLEYKVKEALTYLGENSGTVEYPRQLTLGELTMLYDILALETEGKE